MPEALRGGFVATASIDITIPVLNEERCVRRNVRHWPRAHADCPYPWTITVVDNGSTDNTWGIVEESGRRGRPRIRAIQLGPSGVGVVP